MDWSHLCISFSLQWILCLLLLELAVFISADALEPRGSLGRNLLAKYDCPVDFEFNNYTIVTSKCKPPEYPPKQCCGAFKEFACPYWQELNDYPNCHNIMYSYLNLEGNYPPGLFSQECTNINNGIDCSGYAPPTENSTATSGNLMALSLSPFAAFVAGFSLAFQFS